MKIPGYLSLAAALVLSAAAVWMGALNQDEGWYLYAAGLVAEGKLPYRDFFFTQGPAMPLVYAAFHGIWNAFGLLGARLLTLALGFAGIAFFVALSRRLVPAERRGPVALTVFALLAGNLYHLYYLAIPKTYALASLFVGLGCYLLSFVDSKRFVRVFFGAFALAMAAAARISLGTLLVVFGLWLLVSRRSRALIAFVAGGLLGLALAYGPFLIDDASRAGLLAAQAYHAARGGGDVAWVVGSVSRLVRWYAPLLILLALGWWRPVGGMRLPYAKVLLVGFLSVFAVQMLAPFPYEDYQVPVMALAAVVAAVSAIEARRIPLVMALAFACAFGNPLLERWATNGQDRFWTRKKSAFELPQLRRVAREIETLDPGGKDLLTQDLYLAIETRRKVPPGLEMGPFSMLSDADWRALLESAPCRLAALSGYSFAIMPPACTERPVSDQMALWKLLKERYELVSREEEFGQNATTLLVLRRK